MVNPKFVSNAMREMDSRFFVIEDAAGNVMYHQWQNIALDQAIERFENFVKNCSANSSFVVNVYQSNERLRNGEPTAKNQGMRYEVWVDQVAPTPAPQDNQNNIGIGGLPNLAESMLNVGRLGSVDLHTYLGTKDEIMNLKLQIQQLQMENKYLQDRHNADMERLKKEYEDKLSSDRKIEGIIGSVLPAMGLGGSGMAGINGINGTAEAPVSSAKEKVLKAVNILLQNDPDFPENISKLAELVQKNKTIYQLAVKQLNSL